MRLPSARICVVSVIDSAEYGLPVTTAPSTLPSPRSTSTVPPSGRAGAGPSITTNVFIVGVLAVGSSWPTATPAVSTAAAASNHLEESFTRISSSFTSRPRCFEMSRSILAVRIVEADRADDAVLAEQHVGLDHARTARCDARCERGHRQPNPNDAVGTGQRHARRVRPGMEDRGARVAGVADDGARRHFGRWPLVA